MSRQASRPRQRHKPVSSQKTQGLANPSTSVQRCTPQQSLELVQALVFSSFSCLAYLRNLLPEGCFDDQKCQTNGRHWSYEDFVSGRVDRGSKNSLDSDLKYGVSTLKLLRKGRHGNADEFLRWLERGAFEALKDSVLRAVQLSVFDNPSDSSRVVETYTFSFSYARPAEVGSAVENIELNCPQGRLVTLSTARLAFQNFIRAVNVHCTTLPPLQGKRHMKMHLFYVDGCPIGYQPPGFMSCENAQIMFPENGHKRTYDNGVFDAGHHKTCLKVTYVEDPKGTVTEHYNANDHEVGQNIASRTDDVVDMDYYESNDPLPGDHHFANQRTMENAPQIHYQPSPLPESNVDVERRQSHEELTQDFKSCLNFKSRNDEAAETTVDEMDIGTSLHNSSSASQQQRDFDTRAKLQAMLAPSTQPDSLRDTQQAPFPTGTATQRTRLSQNNVPLRFTRGRADILAQKQLAAIRCQKQNSTVHPDNSIVECQCGWGREEDDMICCERCNTWQHCCCYGYRGRADPRIPDFYLCYRCLLEQDEPRLLQEMRHLALLRKGIHVIEKHGFRGDANLADMLHCDLQTASRVSKHLKSGRFLCGAPGAKKRGFAKTGLPQFILNRSGTTFKKLLEEYFNPAKKIEHLVMQSDHMGSRSAVQDLQSQTNIIEPESDPMAPIYKQGRVASNNADSTMMPAKLMARTNSPALNNSANSTNRKTRESQEQGDCQERKSGRYHLRCREAVPRPTTPRAANTSGKRSSAAAELPLSNQGIKRHRMSMSVHHIDVGATPTPSTTRSRSFISSEL
ncbi:HORMA domain-containing protein [Lineolata rhizophorae]|uniref:HORMA domain-containing protein n=1 Tax=Lineolata rhizophorae TaxID=578093 RepID=A0A6A6P9P1_9PEZI|nr:HORMA domain-containing protein [Lineolata rhizophorae]